MGYIYTAIVRDKEGKIVTYGDYPEYQSPPESVTRLASQPGNTLSTTVRKEGKGQYFDYAGELSGRKVEVKTDIEKLLQQRNSAVSEANAKAKLLAQTTGNPFVSPGAREITRRKAIPAFQNLSNIQSKIETNESLLDMISGTPQTIQKTAHAKARVDNAGTVTDKEGNVQTSAQIRAAEDAQAYRDRNSDVTAYAQQSGIVITSPDPGRLSKVDQQKYNKALIDAQIPLLFPTKNIVTVNSEPKPKSSFYGDVLTTETGFPKTTNPNVVQPTQYVITDKSGNVERKKNLTLNEIRAYQEVGNKIEIESNITKYKVTDPSGKERIFTTKEAADKFAKNYGTPTPVGFAGSLDYNFGERPKVQGANLSDQAFFVGANAQGYIIDTTRQINRPGTFLEGITRPFANILSASKDFGLAVKSGDLTSPAPFTDPSNPFGLPVPKTQTPQKPTATSQIFEGKVPDITDPAILGSAVTEGALLAVGIKAPKVVSRIKGGIQGRINEAKVTKVFSGLESPKVLQSGKIQKFPNFPNAGEFKKSTYEKTKFGQGEYLEKGKLTVKAVKGRPDLIKVESTNPLQDKSIFAVIKKGEVVGIKTIEPETGLTTPKSVRIRTNPNDIFGIEVSKFDLRKTGRGIYETTKKIDVKSPILEASKSSAVQPVARARSFAIEDVIKNPKEFSRYFFQETTVGKTPARPISDVLLAETKSYQSIGTKIQTYPKLPSDVPTRGKSNIKVKTQTPEIFKPFAESTVSTSKSKFDRLGIFGRDKFRKKKVTDSFVSDILTNIKEVDPFTDLTKFTGKVKVTKTKPYPKERFSFEEPFGRPQQLEKPYSKQKIESQVKEESVTQDILFGKKRNLSGIGIVYGELTRYPETTPNKIKELSSLRIDSGLESRSKQSLVGSGDYFKRYGLDVIQTKDSRTDELFKQIPINIQPTKQRERLKPIIASIAITGLEQTPIQRTGLRQTPIIITGLETVPITEIITTPITEPVPRPIPPGFGLGEFGIGFPGFGGGGDDRSRRKKGKKKYIVSSIDPLTPGSIITAGLPQQQVSRSKSIYGRLDVQLGKARRKNQPKEKKFKDPFRL